MRHKRGTDPKNNLSCEKAKKVTSQRKQTATMKLLLVLSLVVGIASAFVGKPMTFRKSTKVFIDDKVAKM